MAGDLPVTQGSDKEQLDGELSIYVEEENFEKGEEE